jgi:hypothetical protein
MSKQIEQFSLPFKTKTQFLLLCFDMPIYSPDINIVQPTAHQVIHFGLCTSFISTALALISNCKCIACCLLYNIDGVQYKDSISKDGNQSDNRVIISVIPRSQLATKRVNATDLTGAGYDAGCNIHLAI